MNFSQELSVGFCLTVLFIVATALLMASKSAPASVMTALPTPTKTISYSVGDVSKHNNQNDCWIIIRNSVYNVTNYLFVHPGGADQIISYCGTDATVAYNSIGKHGSSQAQVDLSSVLIGPLK